MRARIFYSGTHTDNSGNTKRWTPEEVRAIAEKYNRSTGRYAPVVKGHPKLDDPRFAQIDRPVQIVNDSPVPGEVALFAQLGKVVPAFAEEVQAGQWTHCSAKLGQDGTIIHLGVLGAIPPALEECAIEFSTIPGETCYFMEFSASEFADTDTTTEGTSMTPEELKQLTDAVSAGVTAGLDGLKPTLTEISTKLDTVITGKAGGEGGETADAFSKVVDERFSNLEKRTENAEREVRRAEFSRWLDTKEVSKRVAPGIRESVLNTLMDKSELKGEMEFSQGDKTVKGTPVQEYQNRIMNWAEFPLGHEYAAADNDPGKQTTETERADYVKGLLETAKRV